MNHHTATIIRDILPQLLPSSATYVPLVTGTKRAQWSGGKTTPTIPPIHETPSYGVVPGPDSVVLDFDGSPEEVKKGLTKFGELLGFDLIRQSLSIRTASGGVHVWLELPAGSDKVWATKLSQIVPGVKGDVRSGVRFGYVVGPGSQSNKGEYTIISPKSHNKSTPGEYLKPKKLSPKQAKSLCTVPNPADTRKSPTGENPLDDPRVTVEKVSSNVVDNLRKTIAGYERWHEKRAAVYAALSCCYSDETIVKLWWELDICRDTSKKDKEISPREVWADINRLTRSENHGGYCPGRALSRSKKTKKLPETVSLRPTSLEEYWEWKAWKVRQPKDWKAPRVVDLVKIWQKIDATRFGEKSKLLAFAIMESVMQPWSNYGCINVLLGDTFLRERFGAAQHEVHKAKMMLRRIGGLVLTGKQSPKTTSSYTVGEEFISDSLTGLLRSAIYGTQQTLTVDMREGVIYNPFTGEVAMELFAQKDTDRFPPKMELLIPVLDWGVPRPDFWATHGPKNRYSYVHVKARIIPETPQHILEKEEMGKPTMINVENTRYPLGGQELLAKTIADDLPDLVHTSYIPEECKAMIEGTFEYRYDPVLNEKLQEVLERIFNVERVVFHEGEMQSFDYRPSVWIDPVKCIFNMGGDEFGFFDVLDGDMFHPGHRVFGSPNSRRKPVSLPQVIWKREKYLEYLLENEDRLHDGVVKFWADRVKSDGDDVFVATWCGSDYWTEEYVGRLADPIPDELDVTAYLFVQRGLWLHRELFHHDGSHCGHEGVQDIRDTYALPEPPCFNKTVVDTYPETVIVPEELLKALGEVLEGSQEYTREYPSIPVVADIRVLLPESIVGS